MLIPQGEQSSPDSAFHKQQLEFRAEDEGYSERQGLDTWGPALPPGLEGDMPDQVKHREGRRGRVPKPPQGTMAPMYRQQVWKLDSNRSQMRRLVRKLAKPP